MKAKPLCLCASTASFLLLPWAAGAQRAATDSLKLPNPQGLSFSKNISVAGTIGVESSYQSFQWEGSHVPRSYTRFYFAPAVTVGGIPFQGRLSYAPGQAAIPAFNRVSLNFDRAAYERQLKQRAIATLPDASAGTKELKQVTDSLQQLRALEKRLADTSYMQSIARKRLLLKDTAAMDSFTRLQNRQFINHAQQETRQFEVLEQKYAALLAWRQDRSADSVSAALHAAQQQATSPSKPFEPRVSRRIERLDAGTFFPVLTPLSISGIGITGGGAEVKAGRVRISAGSGVNKPFRNFLNRDRFVGQRTRLYSYGGTSLTIDKHWEAGVNQVYVQDLWAASQQASDYAYPIRNYILTAQAKYHAGPFAAEAEVARTTVSVLRVPEERNLGGRLAELDNADNAAALVSLGYALQKTSTEAKAIFRRTGADFNNRALPYLRKDLQSAEAVLTQHFFKRKAGIQLQGAYEENNISVKQLRNGFYRAGAEAWISLNNLPSVRAGYMPARTFNEYIDNDSALYSSSDLRYVYVSHNLNVLNAPVTLGGFYSQAVSATPWYSFTDKNFSGNVLVYLNHKNTFTAIFGQTNITTLEKPILNRFGELCYKRIVSTRLSWAIAGEYRASAEMTIAGLANTLEVVLWKKWDMTLQGGLYQMQNRSGEMQPDLFKRPEARVLSALRYKL